ncbi:LytR/AlgR family response regulator transcription factor [Flavihumibacter profundi]|uniref:LytR/AlgR family response regulator transcription factor n=1 Tax=Flavihumibacter profundi TaxID=2716883 RepID=UPI001CC68F95|nr:LytTR family DNA-binding domain-containing protein [Flavihumibacter profundi]MBZ5855962.1 LytTR family DNA-binding domain-containing protein [Flavihumibacter profundi]
MQVLIVEDELLLAKQLKKLLSASEPAADVVAITNSVLETVSWLQNNPAPDLVLMDIELADGQSFDIFQKVSIPSPIIFTTAYDEYALRAFKVNSIDYLLKPIKEEELKAALQKFRNAVKPQPGKEHLEALLTEMQKLQQSSEYRTRFLVKQGQKMISIDIKDIAYIFSQNKFSYLRTFNNQKYILDYALDELEQSLSPKLFFRVNRQYILNSGSVAAIHSWFNQKLKVEVEPATDEHIVISRDKANAFKAWMGE